MEIQILLGVINHIHLIWPLSLILGWACSSVAAVSNNDAADREFLGRNIFPVANRFLALPGMPKDSLNLESNLLKWKFWLDDNSSRAVASLYFTNRIHADFLIKGTNCVVLTFRDSRINPHIVVAPESSREVARFFAQQKDAFTDESALAYATEFMRLAGHDPENFRLHQGHRLGKGDPEDEDTYLPLPFYEFVWLRKDVKEIRPGEVHHPKVRVVISGLNRQVLIYQRHNLPVCGDFDDCAK